MRENDLRLRNFVSITEDAKKEMWENEIDFESNDFFIVTCLEINELKIYINGSYIEFDYKDIVPIKVDDKILNIFGWEWKIVHQGFHNGEFKIVERYKNGYALIFGDELIPFKYLHQLQNIFYTLKEEELSSPK